METKALELTNTPAAVPSTETRKTATTSHRANINKKLPQTQPEKKPTANVTFKKPATIKQTNHKNVQLSEGKLCRIIGMTYAPAEFQMTTR